MTDHTALFSELLGRPLLPAVFGFGDRLKMPKVLAADDSQIQLLDLNISGSALA